jgi:hypothetical protein
MVQSFAESGEYGNATFWISDKGDSKDCEVYRTLYKDGAKYGEYTGEKQDVSVGDEVVIYGLIMNYKDTPETSANESYLYSQKSNTDPILSSKEATKIVPAAAEAVTFEIEGKNLTEGLAIGISQNASLAEDAMSDLADAVSAPIDEVEDVEDAMVEVLNTPTSASPVSGQNSASARDITVILQLDRTQLARTVFRLNAEETQRVGVNLAGGFA